MFQFDEKPRFGICGKEYEFDIANNEFIEGMAVEFPRLLQSAQEFQWMQDTEIVAPQAADNLQNALIQKCRELTEQARDFIIAALGQAAYDEIFQTRRPNAAEHLQLCAALFDFAAGQRKQIVEKYLDLPKGAAYAADETAPDNTGA